MNGPMDGGGGFLERLRQNETIRKLSGGRPDLIIFGAPLALIAVIAIVVVTLVATTGGGSADDDQAVATATREPQATATSGVNAGQKTPINFDEGAQLTLHDLSLRGAGEPGRGEFNAQTLRIPKINVEAPFTYRVVGPDGQMPNPQGPRDVAYYDFAQWPGLGGVPGDGGNIVLAGHVDYINVGPAVFWDVDKLVPGDIIEIVMEDGSVIQYAVEFNKWTGQADLDWSLIVGGTADESVTLITCTGEFEAGHYDKRQVVWGRRIS